ncbi:GNAT family N-acetyltransferase [uncultured Desulfovibrio sp.]|uniref:GNAT family N-acetyltransferase n=1 Tax=uncultured Desulfovibrio sp. TaxID=167968 RepID=UPI00261587C3|nr:GNAT family N-acetyltransferase [uncultured Desulfovibrio sp.]
MIKFIIKSLCIQDVLALLEGKISLSQIDCAEYLLPHIVLQAALDALGRGTDWFWCAPRLFIDAITGQTLGTASFLTTNDPSVLEIGYGTATEFQGMGIASRGLALMLAEAQAHNSTMRYMSKTATNNRASQRVLEKNGFTPYAKTIDAEDGELVLWSR